MKFLKKLKIKIKVIFTIINYVYKSQKSKLYQYIICIIFFKHCKVLKTTFIILSKLSFAQNLFSKTIVGQCF